MTFVMSVYTNIFVFTQSYKQNSSKLSNEFLFSVLNITNLLLQLLDSVKLKYVCVRVFLDIRSISIS